jgi:hypothetical protein
VFGASPVAAEATHAGVAVVEAATGEVVGRMIWKSSVDELFDVAVLPTRRPGLIGPHQTDRGAAVTTPGGAWWLSAREPEPPASPWPHLDPEGDFDRDDSGSWYTEYVESTRGGVDLDVSRYGEFGVARFVGERESKAPDVGASRRYGEYTPVETIPAREARVVEDKAGKTVR